MKKIILTAAFSVLFAAISFAQIPFTGSWFMKQTVMGTTITDYLSFDNDTQGKANNKFVIDFKMNILGIKAVGSAELSVDGTFTTDGNKLTINWDKDTFVITKTPMVVTYHGETMDDDDEEYNEMLDDIVKEVKEEIEKNAVDEYYDVRVKGDKLTLTSLGDNGKPETDKFSRVK